MYRIMYQVFHGHGFSNPAYVKMVVQYYDCWIKLVPGSWSPGPGLRSGPVGLLVSAPLPAPWSPRAHRSPLELGKSHHPPIGI